MTTVQVQVPDELLENIAQTELQALAQEALLVKLYEMGEISSGWAAEVLSISRREFLDVLGRYGVPIFDDNVDLIAESRRGRE